MFVMFSENINFMMFLLNVSLTLTAFLHQLGANMNSSADAADPPDPADSHNQVSLSAARTLPSTRAGGKDDGSLTNSLKTGDSGETVGQ